MIPRWLLDLGTKVRSAFGPIPPAFPDEWQLLPALIVNESGWLEGAEVERVPSDPSWYYPRLSTPHGDPLAIVCHTSATAPGTARTMATRRSRKRVATDRAASWHLSIEADGRIVQMAPLDVGCWHAIGQIKGAGAANRVSIGIELIGYERGPWPEAQIQGACRVWRAITLSYGIPRRLAMVTHSEIDPDRRSDPGPLWMRDHAPRVLDFAFG